MEEVRKRLSLISDAWNRYVWKYKFIQNQINFTPEVRTNYYGDILGYFNDTLELLSVKSSSTFANSIFNTIGLTQIIFVHHDLMDELLDIFKLPKSSREDKEPNRTIRNQLTGHPLSRNSKKELVSWVFFGNELSDDTIHYILYNKENDFKGEDISHKIDDILKRHSAYLTKYTGKILDKISSVLTIYRKKLLNLDRLLIEGNEINKILEQTDQFFESIYKENYVFRREYLLWYYQNQKKHPRYEFAWKLFLKALSYYLHGKMQDIDEIIAATIGKVAQQEMNEAPEIAIRDGHQPLYQEYNDSPRLHYYLAKLMDRHPINGVSYFKQKFEGRRDIQEELSNMEENISSDKEYFASFEYIKRLLNEPEIL